LFCLRGYLPLSLGRRLLLGLQTGELGLTLRFFSSSSFH
jgi:hypothetical protein